MNWSFMISAEERHLVKVADLNALELLTLNSGDETCIAGAYERIFEALATRANTAPDTLIAWGERYIAWATSFTERDGFPFMTTGWAKCLFDHAISSRRQELARTVARSMLRSYAPLEKEGRWWQKQLHILRC